MAKDRLSELQGQLLLQRQLLTQQRLAQAWQTLPDSPNIDLCAWLVQHQQLDPQHAQLIRSQALQTLPPQVEQAPTLKPQQLIPQTPKSQQQSALPHTNEHSATTIPDYEVVKELGRGGMGVVLLVQKPESGATFVAKLMLAEEPDPEAVARFTKEARALATLNHPNIVAVKSFGKIDDKPYFVMDHVVGRDLKDEINDYIKANGEPPGVEWTLERLIPIAEALVYLHKNNIVHRDLKPANILIEEETNRPVLVDFGLVKTSADLSTTYESEDDLTKTGAVLGTPEYMAPEQLEISSRDGVIPANDVWGFAATLYHCLTGEPPYKGQTAMNIYGQILKGPPTPLKDVRPELPDWLNQLCLASFQQDIQLRVKLPKILMAMQQQSATPLSLESIFKAQKAANRQRRMKQALTGLAIFAFIAVVGIIGFIGLSFEETKLDFMPDCPQLIKDRNFEIYGRLTQRFPQSEVILSLEHNGAEPIIYKNFVWLDDSGEKTDIVAEALNFRTTLNFQKAGDYKLEIAFRDSPNSPPKIAAVRKFYVDFEKPRWTGFKARYSDAGLTLSFELSEANCIVTSAQCKPIQSKDSEKTVDVVLSNSKAPDGHLIKLYVTDKIGNTGPVKQILVVSEIRHFDYLNKLRNDEVLVIMPGQYEAQLEITKPIHVLGMIDLSDPVSETRGQIEQYYAYNPNGQSRITAKTYQREIPPFDFSLKDKKFARWPTLIGSDKPALTVNLPANETQKLQLQNICVLQQRSKIADRAELDARRERAGFVIDLLRIRKQFGDESSPKDKERNAAVQRVLDRFIPQSEKLDIDINKLLKYAYSYTLEQTEGQLRDLAFLSLWSKDKSRSELAKREAIINSGDRPRLRQEKAQLIYRYYEQFYDRAKQPPQNSPMQKIIALAQEGTEFSETVLRDTARGLEEMCESQLIANKALTYRFVYDECNRDPRSDSVPFRLNSGSCVIKNSIIQSAGCFSLFYLSGSNFEAKKPTFVAEDCLFVRDSQQGGIVFSADAKFTNCTLLGVMAPSTDTQIRRRERPFYMNDLGTLVCTYESTVQIDQCQFYNAHDRHIFIGEKDGHFRKNGNLKTSPELTIRGSLLRLSRREGLVVSQTGRLNIDNCDISFAGEEAIYVAWEAAGANIKSSKVYNSGRGDADHPDITPGIRIRHTNLPTSFVNTSIQQCAKFGLEYVQSAELLLDSCQFSNNLHGLGIRLHPRAAREIITVKNCRITDNIEQGLWLEYPDKLTFTNCTIQGNRPNLTKNCKNIVFTDCTIEPERKKK